jgi:hypothetical protein
MVQFTKKIVKDASFDDQRICVAIIAKGCFLCARSAQLGETWHMNP